MEWKASYSVGNESIDAQHRKLLSMCNECEALIGLHGLVSNDRLHLLLNDLSEYVRVHFDYEESLLRLCGYPKLTEHVAEHERYWEQLTEILFNAASGLDERDEVLKLLRQWWIHHILKDDMQYSTCLASQGGA